MRRNEWKLNFTGPVNPMHLFSHGGWCGQWSDRSDEQLNLVLRLSCSRQIWTLLRPSFFLIQKNTSSCVIQRASILPPRRQVTPASQFHIWHTPEDLYPAISVIPAKWVNVKQSVKHFLGVYPRTSCSRLLRIALHQTKNFLFKL